jgi:hypothetical protein
MHPFNGEKVECSVSYAVMPLQRDTEIRNDQSVTEGEPFEFESRSNYRKKEN